MLSKIVVLFYILTSLCLAQDSLGVAKSDNFTIVLKEVAYFTTTNDTMVFKINNVVKIRQIPCCSNNLRCIFYLKSDDHLWRGLYGSQDGKKNKYFCYLPEQDSVEEIGINSKINTFFEDNLFWVEETQNERKEIKIFNFSLKTGELKKIGEIKNFLTKDLCIFISRDNENKIFLVLRNNSGIEIRFDNF